MSSIKDRTERLKSAIDSTVEALTRQAVSLKRVGERLPAAPVNLPVEEAARMLNDLGFCVVPRKVLERAIDVVEVAAKGDEPEGLDATYRLNKLAHNLTACLRAI